MQVLKVKTIVNLTSEQKQELQRLGCEPEPFITWPHELIFAATCDDQQKIGLCAQVCVISVEPMPTYGPAEVKGEQTDAPVIALLTTGVYHGLPAYGHPHCADGVSGVPVTAGAIDLTLMRCVECGNLLVDPHQETITRIEDYIKKQQEEVAAISAGEWDESIVNINARSNKPWCTREMLTRTRKLNIEHGQLTIRDIRVGLCSPCPICEQIKSNNLLCWCCQLMPNGDE